jgi:hypothetical protein
MRPLEEVGKEESALPILLVGIVVERVIGDGCRGREAAPKPTLHGQKGRGSSVRGRT